MLYINIMRLKNCTSLACYGFHIHAFYINICWQCIVERYDYIYKHTAALFLLLFQGQYLIILWKIHGVQILATMAMFMWDMAATLAVSLYLYMYMYLSCSESPIRILWYQMLLQYS